MARNKKPQNPPFDTDLNLKNLSLDTDINLRRKNPSLEQAAITPYMDEHRHHRLHWLGLSLTYRGK